MNEDDETNDGSEAGAGLVVEIDTEMYKDKRQLASYTPVDATTERHLPRAAEDLPLTQ